MITGYSTVSSVVYNGVLMITGYSTVSSDVYNGAL